MLESPHLWLGIAAGVLSFVAYPIYIADILKGHTKPSRVTWWILALLNALLSASYYAAGARDTIWIPISYTIGFSITALLSLKYGEGGWEKLDYFCLFGGIVSAALWYFLTPAVAVYAIIVVDLFGLAPTVYKSCKRPWTENHTSWLIAVVASALNVLAIEAWNPAIAAYPIYVLLTNAIIVYFLYHKPPVCD